MARIREMQERRKAWALLSWRMMPLFAAIVAILVVISLVVKPERSNDYLESL